MCLLLLGCGQKNANIQKQPKKVEEQPFAPTFYKSTLSPIEYLKNDPQKTYEWVKKQVKQAIKNGNIDDEFITSKEKNDRVSIIHKTLKQIHPIVFISGCTNRYNADTKEYIITIETSKLESYEKIDTEDTKTGDSKAERIGVIYIQSTKKNDTYTGKNAFGVESIVNRTDSLSYAIGFPLPEGEPPEFKIKLPIDIESAKTAKENLACLYSVSISEPYTLHFSTHTQATRSNPYEFNNDIRVIFGTIEKIAIINKKTGQTYREYNRK